MYITTPLIKTPFIEETYLKLENTQPSGSFKARGITHLVEKSLEKNKVAVFFASSGGNAGLAAAEAAAACKRPVTVVVPESTSDRIIARLETLGATAIRHGSMWLEADAYLKTLMAREAHPVYVSPFDDPVLWEGHSTLADEIVQQMPVKPSGIVLSVGGGGMYLGVMQGLERAGWLDDVTVYAVETEGANCFALSLAAGKIVHQERPNSIAKSLGSAYVPQAALDYARRSKTVSVIVTDDEAVAGSRLLADGHCIIAEPACGATIAAITTGKVPRDGPLVAIVCGGSSWTAKNIVEGK